MVAVADVDRLLLRVGAGEHKVALAVDDADLDDRILQRAPVRPFDQVAVSFQGATFDHFVAQRKQQSVDAGDGAFDVVLEGDPEVLVVALRLGDVDIPFVLQIGRDQPPQAGQEEGAGDGDDAYQACCRRAVGGFGLVRSSLGGGVVHALVDGARAVHFPGSGN